jgi:hypothetical protein
VYRAQLLHACDCLAVPRMRMYLFVGCVRASIGSIEGVFRGVFRGVLGVYVVYIHV